jgi:hypothetical protein
VDHEADLSAHPEPYEWVDEPDPATKRALVQPDGLRSRRAPTVIAGAERVHALLEAARVAPLPVAEAGAAVSAARADELIREIRAGRETR